MRKIIGLVISVILVVSAFMFLSYFYKSQMQNNTVMQENEQQQTETTKDSRIELPDFTIYDKYGNEISIKSFLGKPTVINFWATWCPFCVEEFDVFQRTYNERGQDVNFIMLDQNDGNRETIEKATKYFEDNELTMPLYFDTDFEAAYLFGVTALPATIVIDEDGYFYGGINGALNYDYLNKLIDGELEIG